MPSRVSQLARALHSQRDGVDYKPCLNDLSGMRPTTGSIAIQLYPMNKGYTLIELLTTITLLAALSAFFTGFFAIRFVARGKELEAVTTLDAIKDAQAAHYVAKGKFAGTFGELGVSVNSTPYYRYSLIEGSGSIKAIAEPNEPFLHSYAATSWVDEQRVKSKVCKSVTWAMTVVPACLPERTREDGGR